MVNSVKSLNSLRTLIRSRLASTYGVFEVYKQPIARNKEKIFGIIEEKFEVARKSKLANKMKDAKAYYTLEMSPPSYNEIEKMKADFQLMMDFFKSGCYKYLTVRQAWLLLLVGTEVGLWFFLGETIGKMHLVGYKV